MATIKGKWRWDIGAEDTAGYFKTVEEQVSFVSNGEEYVGLIKTTFGGGLEIGYMLNDGSSHIFIRDFLGGAPHITESLRIIDFGETEQEVSEEFYNYLIANAHELTIAEKLTKIAENEQKVYDAGIEEGKKSEYDTFWDAFQRNGGRRYYDRAFAEDGSNHGWVYGTSYRPKYPMKPKSANLMYGFSRLPYAAIDPVDFSDCINVSDCFTYYMGGKDLPWLDFRKVTTALRVFAYSSGLEQIWGIQVSETTPLSGWFTGCSGLKEVRFNGTIAQNNVDFSSCTKLSKASIMDIVNHLSYTTTGLKITFSKTAVDKAFETSEGANNGSDSSSWNDDYVGVYNNWNIVLA